MARTFVSYLCSIGLVTLAAGTALVASERDEDPVVIPGAALASIEGTPIDRIGVFRWDAESTSFVPIPFQIDERVAHVFNPGEAMEFTQTVHDIFGEDDGALDSDDEIAFLFADTGGQATVDAPWLDGADDVRISIEVVDARHGGPTTSRWVYVFLGASLPTSPTRYVDWAGEPESDVLTSAFTVEYEDRWLLTGLRVEPPCGDGSDLIDRFKGRAYTYIGIEEDEEIWNMASTYLGGRVGPVRAIRYVRGAASGVNTIHHDVIYRRLWMRRLDARVHPIASATLYIDLLPRGDSYFFSSSVLHGVPVDGQQDFPPETFAPWTVVRTPGGGFATVYEVPSSSLYESIVSVYRDDQGHDDTVPINPEYGDEDDSAIGAHGIELRAIGDTNIHEIPIRFFVYPLCGDVGDSSVGETYFEFRDHPFEVSAAEEWRMLGPIRALRLTRDGDDILLQWPAIAGADGYRVYTSPAPDFPLSSWILLGETTDPSFRDVGVVNDPSDAYYGAVAYGPGGEGAW